MSPRAPVEPATTRVRRLLTLVPWLVARQGVPIEDAAERLGISPAQLKADLELIFLCGYGHMPDELIDARCENGQVFVTNAEEIGRPLRLAVDEAITLLAGLRALADVPGLEDSAVIRRALTKLEEAAGGHAAAAARVHIEISDDTQRETLATVRAALEARHRIRLNYVVPSRDESTDRDVDPMRVINLGGAWYLEAWCHRAQDVRLFRLDRIHSATAMPHVDGTPPAHATPRDIGMYLYQPQPDDHLVTLRLEPAAFWVAEYYPIEHLQEQVDPDGREVRVVTISTHDTGWLRRLMLRLAGAGQVISPTALTECVSADAASALAAYGVTPASEVESR